MTTSLTNIITADKGSPMFRAKWNISQCCVWIITKGYATVVKI